MSARQPWRLPPGAVAAVSVLLSVVIGVWLTVDDLATRTLIAVAVGMLTTIVGLQIDIGLRLAERARRQDQHGRLLELVEQQPHFLPAVTSMLASATATLQTTKVPMFRQAVDNVVESARIRLSELEQGRMHCPANDSALMVDQWAEVQHSVHATTIPRADMAWWQSAVGLRYLERNAQAVARGVEVERIFLLDDLDLDTIDLLDRTAAAGVSVLVVDRATLPADLRINVVLYDGQLCVDELTNADGDVVEFVYSTNTADVARIRTLYGRLRSVARPYAAGLLTVQAPTVTVTAPAVVLPPRSADAQVVELPQH